MNTTIETLKNHISIRKYTEVPISEEMVHELILAGQSASTSNFAQAYTVIRVDRLQTRQAFYEITKGQDHILTAPLFLVFVVDLERARKSTLLYNETMDEGRTEAFIIATVDTALMSQNIMVAAESLGLGGVYIGGIRNNPSLVTELLHLPKNTFPIFGMCLGYPDEHHEKKPRLPVEVILKKETYDDAEEGSFLKAYDEQIQAYYDTRTMSPRNDKWTKQMSRMFSKKLRPHMKKYLEDQCLNHT